ncbi:Hint domain-containing protein [Roseovarius sp. EL26]|uniref:Hint domain-containing protein n=1 Tax=Roseovarius sp. EL26 TaxID=2126672 RepID=UPI0013C4DCB0|nr:Hint domain-containing protein [Roseovarius sp. EL26]
MATLDQSLWLNASGTAEDGSVIVNDGSSSTTVTADFTGIWSSDDPGGSGQDINSNFATSDRTADFSFSEDVENLSFTLNGVNAGGSFNDGYRVLILDENGDPIPFSSITVTSSGSGVNISTNAAGEILIDPDTGFSRTLSFSVAGPVSQVVIVSTPSPDGTSTGGSGISDFTFDVPAPPPCFVTGTLIKTQSGLVAVEDLQIGDMVLTQDNGYQPVRWVGSRVVSGRGRFAPITIKKGTFSNDRDLKVSPNHRVVVSGWRAELIFGHFECLAAAKSLVNGDTICRTPCAAVTYCHVMFDQHEIIFSEGAATESFHISAASLDTIAPEARAEILALFPELNAQSVSCQHLAKPELKVFEAQLLSANLVARAA